MRKLHKSEINQIIKENIALSNEDLLKNTSILFTAMFSVHNPTVWKMRAGMSQMLKNEARMDGDK
jgi:hypothetical protein